MYRSVIETGVVVKTLDGRMTKVETITTDISIHGCEHGARLEKRVSAIGKRPALIGSAAGVGSGGIAFAFWKLIEWLGGA